MAEVQIPGSSPARFLTVNAAALFATGSDTSRTLAFYAEGSLADYGIDDAATGYKGDFDQIAAATVYSYAESLHAGLAKRSVSSIEQISEVQSEITFRIEIAYGELQEIGTEPEPQPNGTLEITESTTLETVHAIDAIEEIRKFPSPFPVGVESHGVAINVDGNNQAEGTDIFIPRSVFTLNWTLEGATITDAIRNGWRDTVGHVNTDTYKPYGAASVGFPPGSLMFMGLTDSLSYSGGSERLSFAFEYRKNIESGSPEVVDGFSIYKDGWEMYSRIVQNEPSPDNGKEKTVTKGFKVLRLFPLASFAAAQLPLSGGGVS